MALKANGRWIQSLPLRFRGASGFEYAETNKASQRNIFASNADIDSRGGTPEGHLYPSAWIWPQKPGFISAFRTVFGEGLLSGFLSLGLPGSVAIAGTSTLTATGFLTANLVATLSGSGVVTGAAAITLGGNAALSGSGVLAGSMTAPAFIDSSLTGLGLLAASPYAPGSLECHITPFTSLSAESLATAVWAASVIENTEPGTMGRELKGKLKKSEFLALKD